MIATSNLPRVQRVYPPQPHAKAPKAGGLSSTDAELQGSLKATVAIRLPGRRQRRRWELRIGGRASGRKLYADMICLDEHGHRSCWEDVSSKIELCRKGHHAVGPDAYDVYRFVR